MVLTELISNGQSSSRSIRVQIAGFLILLLSGCATPQTDDISLLPMYGNVKKTEYQKQADAEYLAKADAHYPNRREASDSVAKAGWNFWYQGNRHSAMRRFNQSWLLDPENHHAYWGFMVILGSQGKYYDSIEMGEKALSLAPDNPNIMCDLAFSKGAYAFSSTIIRSQKADYYRQAVALSEKAATLVPNIHCNTWALNLYQLGEYEAAWEKVKEAEIMGKAYGDEFLRDLEAKMPRPDSI